MEARSMLGRVAAIGLIAMAVTPGAIAEPAAPIPVTVLTAERQSQAKITDEFPGLAAARRSSRLGFQYGGLVDAVRVDVGDRVAEGDVLASLDLRVLNAQQAAARAAIAEAEASVDLARLTERRQQALLEQENVSQQRVDEAVANVAAAEARVALTRAQAEEVSQIIALSQIIAPYDGVITGRLVDEGAVTGPSTPVLDIVEADAVEIRVGLPVAQAGRLEAGSAYAFTVQDRSVTGVLRSATGVVERASQTVAAVFDVADGEIAPGEVARLTLETSISEAGFWVPLSALTEGRRGLWTLFVLHDPEDADGTGVDVSRAVVEVLYATADRAFVRGSITDGDVFVATGVARIVPGQKVSPRDASALSVQRSTEADAG